MVTCVEPPKLQKMKATVLIYIGQKAALTFSKMLAGVMRQKRMDCTMVSVCLQRRRSCRSHACTASYSSISGKRLRASLFKYAYITQRGRGGLTTDPAVFRFHF